MCPKDAVRMILFAQTYQDRDSLIYSVFLIIPDCLNASDLENI